MACNPEFLSRIMTRTIITFETVFQVLAADKVLREKVSCRTVPTPSGLSSSICGISIEILEPENEQLAFATLKTAGIEPKGIHHCNSP